MPLTTGVKTVQHNINSGLFGLFNDSLPDGWGHQLLDRQLKKHLINPMTLPPLDRLCFVGSHGMGALSYEPEVQNNNIIHDDHLDNIASEIRDYQNNDDASHIEDLVQLGCSSSGARPKILINIEHEPWIIKFRSHIDTADIGHIEYAYYLMAKEAGLNMANSRFFSSKAGYGYFGSKRFDKTAHSPIHMHTISGLLHADHRDHSLDYQTILKATLHLTHDIRECEKIFRQCVFNVLSHNKDDHSKNFSFLMQGNGIWHISPSYDLTYSSGPHNEHCTTIMGEGRNPSMLHILQLAKNCNMKQSHALNIIDEVSHAVSNWTLHADRADVRETSANMIQSSLDSIYKNFNKNVE